MARLDGRRVGKAGDVVVVVGSRLRAPRRVDSGPALDRPLAWYDRRHMIYREELSTADPYECPDARQRLRALDPTP